MEGIIDAIVARISLDFLVSLDLLRSGRRAKLSLCYARYSGWRALLLRTTLASFLIYFRVVPSSFLFLSARCLSQVIRSLSLLFSINVFLKFLSRFHERFNTSSSAIITILLETQ